ncbi:MAG TPA: hypothetical protein VGH58_06230 [Solirubrobacterales bacterium]|jgi:hypothetical protein
MRISAPIQRRIAELIHSERGMALPIALFAMIAGMALASAAVVATVNVQEGSHRDSSTKSAIAVADAGANIARMRIDRYAVVLATKPCLRLGAAGVLEGAVAEGDGWCPAVAGTVGGGNYSYRVSPAGSTCGEYRLCVVATGAVGEVSRRIEVAYNESAVQETKEETIPEEKSTSEESSGTTQTSGSTGFEGLIGQEGIELSGNADVRVGVGTNGNITATGNADICGDARHGIGKKFEKTGNAKQCPGYKESEGSKALPPVSSFMPSNISTSNSDYRLVKCAKTNPTREPTGCELDAYSGNRNTTKPWNASTRSITLDANDTLTVSGGDYWVCSISLSGNSQLIMASGVQVRFFFDTPENCNLSSGAAQISLSGNTRIASTSKTVMPAFYLLGSTTVPTSANLSGNAQTEDEFVVYGPNTSINLSGNATYKGVIAGKKIVMSGNGKVEDSASYKPPAEITPVTETSEKKEPTGGGGQVKKTTVTTARYYSPQFYVECAGATAQGAAPNASC